MKRNTGLLPKPAASRHELASISQASGPPVLPALIAAVRCRAGPEKQEKEGGENDNPSPRYTAERTPTMLSARGRSRTSASVMRPRRLAGLRKSA